MNPIKNSDEPLRIMRDESIAGESIKADGSIKHAGLKYDRIWLTSQKDSTEFRIRVDRGLFGKGYSIARWRWAPLKLKNGETILINVNSAAKRLHMSKNEIRKIAAQGEEKFLKLIHQQTQKVTTIAAVAEHYETGDHGKMITKRPVKISEEFAEKVDTGITRKELFKILRTALDFFSSQTIINATVIEKIEGRRLPTAVIAVRDKNGQVNVSAVNVKMSDEATKASILGQGSFGQVRQLLNLSNQKMAGAFKEPSTTFGKQGVEDAINEANKAFLLHGGSVSTVPGLQDPPHIAVNLNAKMLPKDTAQGLFIPYYNLRSLAASNELIGDRVKTQDARLYGVWRLLNGLNFLHKNGIVHGDICSENLFVRKNSDGSFQFDLADLGSARFLRANPNFKVQQPELTAKKVPQDSWIGTSFHNNYTLRKDVDDLEHIIKEAFSIPDNPDQTEAERLKVLEENFQKKQFQRDCYSCGMVMYALLMGQEPLTSWTWSGVDINGLADDIGKLYGNQIAEIFLKLTQADMDKRISVEQALNTIQEVIIEERPDLAEYICKVHPEMIQRFEFNI